MEQKIVLSPQELASMVGQSKEQEKPHIAQANKDDYIRLAKLKLEKQFEPRIQSVQNRVNKAEDALAEFSTSERDKLANEQIRAEFAELIGGVEGAIRELNEAGRKATVKLEEFVGKRIPEFVVEMKESVWITGISASLSELRAIIKIAHYEHPVKCVPKKALLDWIKAKEAKAAAVAKAKSDLEILMKCKTKADKAVLGEVEESLLEHMIGKVSETKEIQEDINARVEQALQSRLLGAGDSDEE